MRYTNHSCLTRRHEGGGVVLVSLSSRHVSQSRGGPAAAGILKGGCGSASPLELPPRPGL